MSGVAASLGYLVNPLMLVPVVALAMVLAWHRRRALAVVFIGFALIAPLGWGMRNLSHDLPSERSGDSRAWINMVQGASPEYHDAYRGTIRGDADSRIRLDRIGAAQQRAVLKPRTALDYVISRVAAEPGRFLKWYVVDKPLLLWDWSIRMGAGDIYVYPTYSSPFETSVVLYGWKSLAHAMNGVLAGLVLVACVLNLLQILASRDVMDRVVVRGVVIGMLGSLVAAHVVFQAEPRYAIPYRAFQFAACAALVGMAMSKLPGMKTKNDA